MDNRAVTRRSVRLAARPPSRRPTKRKGATLCPSRFNACVREDNGTLLVFNSLTSALIQFQGRTADKVAEILEGRRTARGALAEYLSQQGLVVPADRDELDLAAQLHEIPFESDESLGLMLLPHENCNFRCTYCYEEFAKNAMNPDVVEGVIALVRRRAPTLRILSLGWFGGEPLLAFNIVEDVATRLREICAANGVAFSSEMTTNGYLLDAERARRCIAAGITRYQITLDGPPESHNQTRRLVGGGGTFERIFANLCHLRDHADGFHVAIRVNFSPVSLPKLPEFVQRLGQTFGHDDRFSMRFRPIGRWGGPNDQHLIVCGKDEGADQEVSLMAMASNAGFSLQTWASGMRPFGTVCYAANPRHFVIGSDGIVYKCTVAFNDPRNHVGRIDRQGNLNLRDDLVRIWTRSGEETDEGCRTCGFRPACQGNLCPLERIEGQEKRCPTTKTHMGRILPLLAHDARRSAIVAS